MRFRFGFTGNDLGVRIAVAIVLALFVLGGLGYCSRADAEEQGLSVGFGVATAGSEACFESLLLTQAFQDGRWLGYFSSHGPADSCRTSEEPVDANISAGILRTTHLGAWTIGFGAGVLEHGDIAVGPSFLDEQDPPRNSERVQFCANILVRRRILERFVLDVVHCSTGGSTHYNRGLNTMALGFRF